ncbi:MAG TPA: N-formylglutamate amidohydrolase [Candidatus Polarisedimenticolaceae bacterium]|nr:N-formylglutamate amidohydrolase [Candidatus Polarisedimenticolaceae bacterium]
MGFEPKQILISCEHASNRLPPELEAPTELLDLHVAWDPGALIVAERLAARFAAPLHQGRYSRLVVDLNRTVGNSRLIRRVSDGHRIPFNRGLRPGEIERRIERYYRPYRQAVERGVTEIVRREGRCVHLTIHSFTPVLRGKVRGNDVGLMYDPSRRPEADLMRELRGKLTEATGLVVWLNKPYSGTADGIQPRFREAYPADRYVGIELELNQKHAADTRASIAIADAFAGALEGLRWLKAPAALSA